MDLLTPRSRSYGGEGTGAPVAGTEGVGPGETQEGPSRGGEQDLGGLTRARGLGTHRTATRSSRGRQRMLVAGAGLDVKGRDGECPTLGYTTPRKCP